MDEREVALEPAQVEVVVEAHDDERAVDVADDREAATVAVAADDGRRRRDAFVDPAVGACAGVGQHPVADGERDAGLGQLAPQARPHTCRARGRAVVQLRVSR